MDVTTASDMPGVVKNVCAQGKGPVLSFKDGGTIYPRDLFRLAQQTAKEENIPYQIKTYPSGGTDAGSIHKGVDGGKSGGGLSAGTVYPCRRQHPAQIRYYRRLPAVGRPA